jgi:hypothetical protein
MHKFWWGKLNVHIDDRAEERTCARHLIMNCQEWPSVVQHLHASANISSRINIKQNANKKKIINTPHHITSHHITSHHITSHHITSYTRIQHHNIHTCMNHTQHNSTHTTNQKHNETPQHVHTNNTHYPHYHHWLIRHPHIFKNNYGSCTVCSIAYTNARVGVSCGGRAIVCNNLFCQSIVKRVAQTCVGKHPRVPGTEDRNYMFMTRMVLQKHNCYRMVIAIRHPYRIPR